MNRTHLQGSRFPAGRDNARVEDGWSGSPEVFEVGVAGSRRPPRAALTTPGASAVVRSVRRMKEKTCMRETELELERTSYSLNSGRRRKETVLKLGGWAKARA